MLRISIILILYLGYNTALPSNIILSKLDSSLRYQYATDSNGKNHLVDLWMSITDVFNAPRFNPIQSNVYHLFTRENPSISQPLVLNNPGLVGNSNFKSNKRTIVLIHGWMDSAISDFNTVLVPTFLAAEDVNVLVVDWSAGASSIIYRLVIENTIASGKAVAQFIDWINELTGSTPQQFHIVGHGFGGHQAGIAGRNVNGDVDYVTGLDPAFIGWVNHVDRFHPDDGVYTEVIHTNYGINGYLADLAKVDFYPNGGLSMPGCDSNACDHARSFFYFAESVSSGGFTGTQCLNYITAVLNMCNMPRRLQMGGLRAKHGETGVFYLDTNYSSPFSQG